MFLKYDVKYMQQKSDTLQPFFDIVKIFANCRKNKFYMG